MPNRLVHEVHALIAFGRPYSQVHHKKDRFSQRAPGAIHRKVKHRKYQNYGVYWCFSDPFSAKERDSVSRITRWKSTEIAEQYMVSLSHDVDDKIWDFDGTSRDRRRVIREYWESFCVWLILNPAILKSWAGVDVIAGRIHRVVNGVEVWEEEPALIEEYSMLYRKVCFLIDRNKKLSQMLIMYGSL